MDNKKGDCDNKEKGQSGEIIKLFSSAKKLREKTKNGRDIPRVIF